MSENGFEPEPNPYATPEVASGKSKSCLVRGLLMAAGMAANVVFSWFLLIITLEMDNAVFYVGPGILILECLVGITLMVKRKLSAFWVAATIMAVIILLLLTACLGLLMNTNFH